MKSLWIALASVVSISHASADVSVPDEPYANSGPAKSIARDVDSVVHLIEKTCVKDNAAAVESSLAEWDGKIARLADATDRTTWTKYLSELRAIYKTHAAGVPGLGSYAELTAKYAKTNAALTAARPTATSMPADATGAKQLADGITAYKAGLTDAAAFYKQLSARSNCAAHAGDWEALAKQAQSADQEMASLVYQLLDADARALNQFASNVPQVTEPSQDWWGYIHYAGNVLESLAKVQQVASKLDALVTLGPLAGGGDMSMIPGNAKAAKEYLAKYVPLARQLVGEMMVPKAPGDAKQLAELKKLLATYETGKQIGTSSARKPGVESYEEWDGGRKYLVVKKKYSGYYVWKPLKPSPTLPVIDGIAPSELCELWATNLVLYEKGGPSHSPLKKWRGSGSVFIGHMLCANKDKKSSRPYK